MKNPTKRGLTPLNQYFCIGILVFLVFCFLPFFLILTLEINDNNSSSSTSVSSQAHIFDDYSQVIGLYSPLDAVEDVALELDVSMMNPKADPCQDPVDYWCGDWIAETGAYRKSHPVSFSLAQQHAVQSVATILAIEKERSWDASPIARFHEGCTRTRINSETWGKGSTIFTELLNDIKTLKWNGNTMAELFGRLAAVGASIPLDMMPMPNPTDTINGGWVIQTLPGGIISSEGASSGYIHSSTFSSMWRHALDAHNSMAKINSKMGSALRVIRMLDSTYQTSTRRSCWQERQATDGEQTSWASYFQDRDCWSHDLWNITDLQSLGYSNFNWTVFFYHMTGSSEIPNASFVWLPLGSSWVSTVTNPNSFPVEDWRSYLETSLRWASGEYMASADPATTGVTSVIAHSTRSRGWSTSSLGIQKRLSRRKHWDMELRPLKRTGAQKWVQTPITSGQRAAKNGVEMFSSELCTELSFVHLQHMFEHYYIEALGLNSAETRLEISGLLRAGVSEFTRLIRSETPSWTEPTRQFFIRKLDSLLIAIGSPPYQMLETANFTRQLFDDAFPAISEAPESLVQNMFIVRRKRLADAWALSSVPRRGTPVEDMPTYEINAYYDPTLNTVTLLAAILQPPFYSRNIVDRELLYSRILAIICHELGHSVDPNGRVTDWSGSIMPAGFWTQASKALDRQAFRETEECLIDLYDNAVSSNGNRDNGAHTLGENMADTIGLRIGLNTMLASMPEAKESREMQQKFYGGWAQMWCNRLSGSQELDALTNDVHSLHEFRIAVPLSNMPEYSDAFQCQEGSRMRRDHTCEFFH